MAKKPKQPPLDLTGKKIGRLTVTGPAPRNSRVFKGTRTGEKKWAARCDCGWSGTVTHSAFLGGTRECRLCAERKWAAKMKLTQESIIRLREARKAAGKDPDSPLPREL